MSDDVESFDDCKAIAQTEKALLVNIPDLGEKWIPQSQIDEDSEVNGKGDEGTLIVKAWFAKREGWL